MLAGVAEWQTRTFKGRVGDRVGSSPTTSTKQNKSEQTARIFLFVLFFFIFSFFTFLYFGFVLK